MCLWLPLLLSQALGAPADSERATLAAAAASLRDDAPPPTPISLGQQRLAWSERYARGDTATQRRILRAATQAWSRALTDDVLPRWLGVPWGSGAASAPPRAVAPTSVNCASFIVAALEAADFQFAHRRQLAAAPALRILEALAADGAIARVRGTMAEVARHLLRRAGVYLVGLPRHIAFAVVRGGAVRLVHASRRAKRVVSEPADTSSVLGRAGHGEVFVVALAMEDPEDPSADALTSRWLKGSRLGPP